MPFSPDLGVLDNYIASSQNQPVLMVETFPTF
jgi:hypothetical protein